VQYPPAWRCVQHVAFSVGQIPEVVLWLTEQHLLAQHPPGLATAQALPMSLHPLSLLHLPL